MRLLLDEMWPPHIAEQFRNRGHDVTAVSERPDLRGQPDEVVFETAQREGYAIVTENVSDYRPLGVAAIQQGRRHYGLIFTSNRQFPRHDPRTPGRLVTALNKLLSEDPDSLGPEYWLAG